MIQQRPARYNAPLRVTTTPNRAPHKNRLFFWAYAYAYAYGVLAQVRLPSSPRYPKRTGGCALRSRQIGVAQPPVFPTAAQVPARQPLARSLAYLTLRSRAACQPATNERGLQSKFHDDDRFPRPDILTTRPPAFRLVIPQDSHRLTDFRGSLTPPYRGRITRGFLMAFGFWRCVFTPLPPYSPFFSL
ncbi:hypothetical protein CSPX01_08218 [Colletotrichum filicis]|nr:hypothetical protein CSPX01_08218 [Colletotrichum filicis]